jgi:hypothetical protein
MAWGDEELDRIYAQLKAGLEPQQVTVRTFIGWFGAQRRSWFNVDIIRVSLKNHEIITVPDFENIYIDSLISFQTIPKKEQIQLPPIEEERVDPTYRISRLESANKPPVSVKPDSLISEAITLMIAHGFSQLPVMTSERDVKGIITWVSIGGKIALNMPCIFVRECMINHKEISDDTYIFAAVDDIIANEYVLIRNANRVISGIVTTSDLSLQFRKLGEPFLLLGEMENYIRRILQNKFAVEELKAACDSSDTERQINDISDLTLGEYQRIIENTDNWNKLGLKVDRQIFIKYMNEVREIRNDVMHFDPDGITQEDIEKLRNFVRLLQYLAWAGAI